jgi:hypothetical protein
MPSLNENKEEKEDMPKPDENAEQIQQQEQKDEQMPQTEKIKKEKDEQMQPPEIKETVEEMQKPADEIEVIGGQMPPPDKDKPSSKEINEKEEQMPIIMTQFPETNTAFNVNEMSRKVIRKTFRNGIFIINANINYFLTFTS